jgi:hypothetical protein
MADGLSPDGAGPQLYVLWEVFRGNSLNVVGAQGKVGAYGAGALGKKSQSRKVRSGFYANG